MTVNIGHIAFDHVVYDSAGDVLYLSVGEPQEAVDSVLTPEGLVVRLDGTGEIIGITLINAKWLTENSELTVSLPVPREQVELAFA